MLLYRILDEQSRDDKNRREVLSFSERLADSLPPEGACAATFVSVYPAGFKVLGGNFCSWG